MSSLHRAQVNLCGLVYYNGAFALLNWWKTTGQITLNRTVGGQLVGKAIFDSNYFDPNTGELVNPVPSDVVSFQSVFYSPINSYQTTGGSDFSGEPMVVEWDGDPSATIVIDLLTSGAVAAHATDPNKVEFTFGNSPSNTQLRVIVSDRNNPPRNIRIYQKRYASAVAAGKYFNPDWIRDIRDFGCARFMDWMSTNNSDIADFSQLADFRYNWVGSGFNDGKIAAATPLGGRGGIHPSVICQFVQESGIREVHVNIPVRATDSLITQFATYMKANCPVHVLYEFSNECWHFGFNQAFYCRLLASKVSAWGKQVTAITRGNPTTFTVPGHGYSNGASVLPFIDVVGWENYNKYNFSQTAFTATVIDANTFTLPFDSSGLPSFSGTTSSVILSTQSDSNQWGYGYRATQMMILIKNIYQDNSRWGGVINTQSVGTAPLTAQVIGINQAIADSGGGYTIPQLFSGGVQVAPYFAGTQIVGKSFTGISKTNPANVYLAGHGYSNGTRLKLYCQTGPAVDAYVTLSNVTANAFDINLDLSAASGYAADTTLSSGATTNATSLSVASATGILNGQSIGILLDSGAWHWTTVNGAPSGNTVTIATGLPSAAASGKRVLTYTAGSNNWVADPSFWDICDQSETNNTNDPVTYPSKYTYFQQQMAKLATVGSCDITTLSTSVHWQNYLTNYLPLLKTAAVNLGLTLGQYEGNWGLTFNPVIAGKGHPKALEFLYNCANSSEISVVYAAMFKGSIALGVRPSKFQDIGAISLNGAWAGIRWYPTTANGGTTDNSNPVWNAIKLYRDQAVPETWGVRYGT